MKRILTLCLALSLMLPLTAFGVEEQSTFTDVSPDDWFAPYVEVCVEEGLMLGTGEGKFSPYQDLTSAECILLIARLHQLMTEGSVSPLPQPPEDWGTWVITGRDGTLLFSAEDYYGISIGNESSLIELPLERVVPLTGQSGVLTLNDGIHFEGTFTVEEDQAGLSLEGLSPSDCDFISDGWYLAERLAPIPRWAWEGVYYIEAKGIGLNLNYGYWDQTPADRFGFLTALESVVDPQSLEQLNTVETLPDAPLRPYAGGFGAFYRAGVLSGTDEYGTFDGSLPLTRATAATMLARILRPELRLAYTLSPYPWETKYELTELRVNANDWWSGMSSWTEPSRSDHSLELETLWVSPYQGSNIEYDKCGILGIDDQWIIEPGQYASIGPFSPDGLASVGSTFYLFDPDRKLGVIDAEGREILPMIYDDVCLGGDGMIGAFSSGEQLLYLFDSQGEPLGQLSAQGIIACGIREGLILILDRETALSGYMDLTGQVVIPPQFEAAGLFYEGRAAVVKDGKTGYIDPTGQLVIPCQYEAISQFGNEHHFRDAGALVVDEEGYGLMIDRDGNQLSPRRYESLDADFSPNGVAFYGYWDEEAQSFREGYLDTQGREHPMPEAYFRNPYHAIAFSGGYYLISWGNSWGGFYNYMDTDGKLLSPVWFREASPMTEEGTALVLQDPFGTYFRLELEK